MKKSTATPFSDYCELLSPEDSGVLRDFFADFELHCSLPKSETRRLREDFEQAILYYLDRGDSLEKALELLSPRNLGGFYARPPSLWFPLDDAAKIYPISMDHGRMAVFRMSVYLKAPVVPELLQMALNFTIKRFPTFATTLKKGFFWHYLDTTKRRFCVQLENDIPCQPLKVSHSGSQSFRVLYYQNRISVEFFHVLTDGTGGMTFLKVLTAEYLRLTGLPITPDASLWDCNATPDSEEYENAFAKVPLSGSASGFVDSMALQMNAPLSEIKPCRLLHLKMNTAFLKKVAEQYHTSVTVYLTALMFLANKACIDELHGDISVQIPVNMRKFYPSKTVRNFSMYCGIRIPIQEIRDLPSLLERVREQMQAKTSLDAMSEMLTSTERMVGMLKFVPLAVKQPVAKRVYGILGDKIFTNTLSNLGVVTMPPECSEAIEAMDFVLGSVITNRVGCAVVTFNNTTVFSITKATVDPSFEEKLYDLLAADGIPVEVEGSEVYEG